MLSHVSLTQVNREDNMGQHSVPRGEKSTAGAANGSPGDGKKYEGKHREGTAKGSSGQQGKK